MPVGEFSCGARAGGRAWRVGAVVAVVVGCSDGDSPAMPLDAGRGDSAVEAGGDGPAGPPVCRLRFSNSTANITAPGVPLGESCPGERTDDGMGHPFIDVQPGDMQAGVVRSFSIWQFETRAPAGTVLKIEDGYDELASRGVSVRYLEFDASSETRTWRADRGVVRLVDTRDEAYTMEFAAVHLVPDTSAAGSNGASGAFQVDGTVVSELP
jgi:hypothetical protein